MIKNLPDYLSKKILDNSVAKDLKIAIDEWYIYDCKENYISDKKCVCNKEKVKYCFSLKNSHNDKIITPICSSCLKKLGRDDFKEQILIYEQMFEILNDEKEKRFINLEYFSRKFLFFLYDNGAFKPTKYNKFDGKKDYLFLLEMFNKKSKPTEIENKKIKGIIFYSVIPFVKTEIKKKSIFI